MILVNPSDDLWYRSPPLSLGYLAAALRKAGSAVRAVDFGVRRSPYADLRRCLAEESEPVVGITANVTTIRGATKIARFVRRTAPRAKIVMGGPHPSSSYRVLVPGHCDAVLIGEGDLVVADLAKGTPFHEIPGLVFWDGELKVNPGNGHVADLDSLPFPDWDFLPLRAYRHPGRLPALPMMTSRGCPHTCINCTKVVHGRTVRERSPQNVIAEIEQGIARWGIREVFLWDDNFTLNRERAKEICRLIIRHRLHRRIRFLIPSGIRADIYDEELFDLFQHAGFYFIGVAVESGRQATIDRLGKKLDLTKVHRTVQALTKRHIRVALYFMMGLPFETTDDMRETIRFAKTLPAHHIHFFLVLPFPGTPLYDEVARCGRFINDPALGLPSYDTALSCFEVDQYSRDELAALLKRAYREFYCRPTQIMRTLSLLLRDPQDIGYILSTVWRILTKGRRG